jgi:hypothetical protein
VSLVTTDANGNAHAVALLSFVNNATVTIIRANDGTIALPTDEQLCFSLPFDCVIESIYATFGALAAFTLPSESAATPYVQLYSAPSDSNTFSPLAQTIAAPTQAYSGHIAINTLRTAAVTQQTAPLPAGTRILIVGALSISGTPLQQSYYFYFTGGIGIRATV